MFDDNDFGDGEFNIDDLFGPMGFFTSDEVDGIRNRHIEEGHKPYSDKEFGQIVRWMEEVSINQILLNMVLDGGIDIVFDSEKMKDLEENGNVGFLFALTKSKSAEMNMMETLAEEPPKFIDRDLFRGGTKELG